MQPVDDSRLQEPGHGEPATLDEHPPEPAISEGDDDVSRFEPVGVGHRELDHTGFDDGVTRPTSMHDERRRRTVGEDVSAGGQPVRGVEHHAHRVLAFNVADGETRVVGDDRTGPDHDGVHQGPKSVETSDIRGARDVVRMPVFSGDPAIETLSGLRDDQVRPDLQGQEEVEKVTRLVGHRRGGRPGAGGLDLQPETRPGIMVHPYRGVRSG